MFVAIGTAYSNYELLLNMIISSCFLLCCWWKSNLNHKVMYP